MESQGTGNGGPYMPRHLDLNLFCESVVSVAELLSEEGQCVWVRSFGTFLRLMLGPVNVGSVTQT